jgi:EAL domain-containing protein (putative c-di-GMP-specific phosphodiesterase class I)
MSSNLGLDVIAEGVAIRAQESFLKKAGCRSFQGYLFGKPRTALSFESTLMA